MTVSGHQIREARKLLGWSLGELRARTKVRLDTLERVDGDDKVPTIAVSTAVRIQQAFEDAGIQFLPYNGEGPGVRLRWLASDEKASPGEQDG